MTNPPGQRMMERLQILRYPMDAEVQGVHRLAMVVVIKALPGVQQAYEYTKKLHVAMAFIPVPF